MVLDYQDYFTNTLVIPISVIIFTLQGIIAFVCPLLIKLKHQRLRKSEIIGCIFAVVCFVVCIIQASQNLIYGGIYLFREKEDDALTRTGVIESICEPTERFPGFKTNHRYGADVVIDGEEYFAITCEDYKEGDCVTIEYLPKSRFIMSIFPSDSIEADNDKTTVSSMQSIKQQESITKHTATVKNDSETVSSTEYRYSYDDRGNITQITNASGEIQNRYFYDDLGQLIREDNSAVNRTIVWSYDNAGNITRKRIWSFKTTAATAENDYSELGTPTYNYSYTYGNSECGRGVKGR